MPMFAQPELAAIQQELRDCTFDEFFDRRGIACPNARKVLWRTPVPIMQAALDVMHTHAGAIDAALLGMFDTFGLKFEEFPLGVLDDATAIVSTGVFATKAQLQTLEDRMILRVQ